MANSNLEFRICEEDQKFVIRDQADVRYGVYDRREEAQEALEGWRTYYGES